MITDKKARKERPIARGVLDYFPDAIAEVANVSYVGNQQHNPGEEMRWAKEKSNDHADCIARHLIERGTMDEDGLRHSAKAAWRALAMLQIEIEAAEKNPIQEYVERVEAEEKAAVEYTKIDFGKATERAKTAIVTKHFDRPERERDFRELIRLGCPDQVARLIVMGTTYTDVLRPDAPWHPYVYVAGPMRGIPGFNFPAFDAARDELLKRGYNVISPADIDRAHDKNADKPDKVDVTDQTRFVFRDFYALYFLKKIDKGNNAIVMLRNYERSTGATAERALALWLGLNVREIGEFGPAELQIYRRPASSVVNTYRLCGDVPQFQNRDGWENSVNFRTAADFNQAIQRGELIPCEPSASCGKAPSSPTVTGGGTSTTTVSSLTGKHTAAPKAPSRPD